MIKSKVSYGFAAFQLKNTGPESEQTLGEKVTEREREREREREVLIFKALCTLKQLL